MPGTRFASLEVWRLSLPLRLTFSHNLATRNRAETLVLELTTANGRTGYGQALPRSYLTGETPESVVESVRLLWERLSEIPPSSFTGFERATAALTPLFEEADRQRMNAAYAALDIAVLDAAGKENGFPAAPPAPRPRPAMELVAAIPAAPPGKAAWLARILGWLGYRRFKVKVGKDAETDRRRIEAVRRAVGEKAWLAADANQAWGYAEAVERMRELARCGVRVVEEPLVRELAREVDFAALEKETAIAVMADESLCTVADARSLLERGSPSWWNIRLAKNGGMTGAARFHRMAHENGARIYGGILVGETGLLAAAAQRSLFSVDCECAEYGFPRIFLRGDPFRGAPGGYRGRLLPPPPATPGLGVAIKRDVLLRNGRLLCELKK